MPQELIYTSVPKGLKSGSSGFSTVLHTVGMAPNLIGRLENLSGYTYLFPPDSSQASLNPAVLAHYKLELAGKAFHVISRNAPYGMDYTGRSNNLAHHIVFQPNEVLPSCGPAILLQKSMEKEFKGAPRVMPFAREVSFAIPPRTICNAWQKAAGDAGWAAQLAGTAQTDQLAVVLYRPGMDTIALIAEALHLLPENERWQVTFSTCFTSSQAGLKCQWRFIPLIPEERPKIPPKALVLDLTKPMGKAPDSPLAELARTGRIPRQAIKAVPQETPHSLPDIPAPRSVPTPHSVPGSSVPKDYWQRPVPGQGPKGPMGIPVASFDPQRQYVPKKNKSGLVLLISGIAGLLLFVILGVTIISLMKQNKQVAVDDPYSYETQPYDDPDSEDNDQTEPDAEESGEEDAQEEADKDDPPKEQPIQKVEEPSTDPEPPKEEKRPKEEKSKARKDPKPEYIVKYDDQDVKFDRVCKNLDSKNLHISVPEGKDIIKLQLESQDGSFNLDTMNLRIVKNLKGDKEIEFLKFDLESFFPGEGFTPELLREFCDHCSFTTDEELKRVPVFGSNNTLAALLDAKVGNDKYSFKYEIKNCPGEPQLQTKSGELISDNNGKYPNGIEMTIRSNILTLKIPKKLFDWQIICFAEKTESSNEAEPSYPDNPDKTLKDIAREDFWYDTQKEQPWLPMYASIEAFEQFHLGKNGEEIQNEKDGNNPVIRIIKNPNETAFQMKSVVDDPTKLPPKMTFKIFQGNEEKSYTIFFTEPQFNMKKLSFSNSPKVGNSSNIKIELLSCSDPNPRIKLNINQKDVYLPFNVKIEEIDNNSLVIFTQVNSQQRLVAKAIIQEEKLVLQLLENPENWPLKSFEHIQFSWRIMEDGHIRLKSE